MSIKPITSTRLKTFVLLGHSNADGWAPSQDALASTPGVNHLLSKATNPETDPENAYWDGVFVATSRQDWPDSGGTPATPSTPGDLEWLEMTVANAWSPAAPHPHPTPYNYANVAGACYPRWLYNAYDIAGGAQIDGNPSSFRGVRTGLEVPFSYSWKHYWQQQVGIVKVAYSSSFFMAAEGGAAAAAWIDPFGLAGRLPSSPDYVPSAVLSSYGYYAYWTPADAFDFNPYSERFYKQWYDKMVGAAAKLAQDGQKIDVQCVIAWFGDNDANAWSPEVLRRDFDSCVRAFVKRIRYDLVQNDWTTLPMEQIPIIWPGVHPLYANTVYPTEDTTAICNGIIQTIANDDPYMTWVDSSDWSMLDDENLSIYQIPNVVALLNGATHYGPAGYRQAAADIFDAWLEMREDPYDALDQDDCLTLSQVRDRVRTYYTRGRSGTDVDDTTVDQHINAAMYHCLNLCGDNAWWLRNREIGTLTLDANNVATLPKYVNRALKITVAHDPTYPIDFEQLGHVEGGRMQILLKERKGGTYTLDYILKPKELTRPDQILPAPRNVAEWIIVEACARLARASTNMALRADLMSESQRLQQDALRSMGQMQRTKKDRLYTQRRFPNLGYSRYRGFGGWGRDS